MIPEAIEKRALFNKYLEESVNLNNEIETLKEDLKEKLNFVDQEVGKDYLPSFKEILKVRINEAKVAKEAETKATAIAESGILKQYINL